jgi:hypothetical protein
MQSTIPSKSIRASSSHSNSGTATLLIYQGLGFIHYLLMRHGGLRFRQSLFHFVSEPGVVRFWICR